MQIYAYVNVDIRFNYVVVVHEPDDSKVASKICICGGVQSSMRDEGSSSMQEDALSIKKVMQESKQIVTANESE